MWILRLPDDGHKTRSKHVAVNIRNIQIFVSWGILNTSINSVRKVLTQVFYFQTTRCHKTGTPVVAIFSADIYIYIYIP